MQFTVTLSGDFLKRSYAKRLFRGWWKLVLAAVAAIAVSVWEIRSDSLGLFSLFAFSGIGFYLLIAAIAWRRQSKGLDEWLRQQEGAPVVYSLSDEAVESTAKIGSTKLKWEAFSSLTLSDFDTLLGYASQGALTLPTEQVPSAALDFLKQQFLASGKKVEDRRKKI